MGRIIIVRKTGANFEGSHLYGCGPTELCNSCRLRFRCFTERKGEAIEINLDEIMATDLPRVGSLEWNFALEKYLHGRVLTLVETATRYEVWSVVK